jgi:carbon-monoxide dehydrogenase large subunit
VPTVEVAHVETLSPFTVGGMKGMGEGGAIAPGPVIAGAVQDALAPLDVSFVGSIPVTPSRVVELIRDAQDRRPGV